jgi:class 3 adenylate cyclase/tetratricopeptide (TPR) repeat protein
VVPVAQLVDASVRLRPYVPRLLIQWLLEAPGTTVREIDGSVVFVDISGFTSMSERLARRGKEGAEEVTDVLGAVFSRLLGTAYGNGGGLIKFGGDALLLLFTGDEHPRKAARAAIGMRRTLREIGKIDTSAGKVVLRMSVGVHSGRFHFFLVGDSHRELIVTGPAASRIVQMESTAAAGEILVSQDTAASLDPRTLGDTKGEGVLLRREPPGVAFDSVETEVPFAGVDVLSCVPLGLRDHLLSGQVDPEHRTVTIAFVHFDGIDAVMDEQGADAIAFGLQELIGCVQAAADKHAVSVLGSDIDHDGGKIILVSGVPRAAGDDEERMLHTVRAIMDARTTVPVRIGVNRGPVFAGDIGPPFRRTYTVMGDAVNLAARVMAMALPGQILATGSVLDASSAAFNALALEPFTVKGKRDPVHAFMVGQPTGAKQKGDDREFPLVGRDVEMDAIRRALLEVRAGHGSVIELVGDAGMGKTRVLREFLAEAADVPHLVAGCELYEASVPYLPFRRLFRLLLGVPSTDERIVLAHRLREAVHHVAPDLVPWLPLIAAVADVDVPPTEEADELSPEFRKAKLEEVTTDLIARLVTESTLVAIEDVHWMDEASADLLRHIATRIASLPWLVCVTRRNEKSGFYVPDVPRCTTLPLAALSQDSVSELIGLATEAVPLLPHEIEELGQLSAGNPLFLQELLHVAGRVGTAQGLPDSIESMVAVQMDRLLPPDRRILRLAAVLGTGFDEELLVAVLEGEQAVEPGAWGRLSEFLVDEGNGKHRFRHALVRDAAYGGLPYRRRRELHARAGRAIVRSAGDSPEDRAELLSTHFFLAGEYEEALRYSLVAAERAASAYANLEASRFYRRATETARRIGVERAALARTLESLGDVLERAGLYREAGDAYVEARRASTGLAEREAALILKRARLEDKAGKPSSGVRWLGRALKVLEGASGRDVDAQRARIAATFAAIRAGQGRAKEAIRWGEEAIAKAEAIGELEALADAHYMIAWTRMNLGETGQGSHLEEALALFERTGNLQRQGDVLTVHGAVAYWDGRWTEAVEKYERGRERSTRAGDVVGAAVATMNIAEIRSDQGRLEEAAMLAREALQVFRAARYTELTALVTSMLARTASRAGHQVEAAEHLVEALRLAEEGGNHLLQVGVIGLMAEDLARHGEAAAARERCADAARRAVLIGGPGVHESLLERVRGFALMQLGELDDAGRVLDRSLGKARESGLTYEVALTSLVRADLGRIRNDGSDLEANAEAAEILGRLGVVSVDAIALSPTAGDLALGPRVAETEVGLLDRQLAAPVAEV